MTVQRGDQVIESHTANLNGNCATEITWQNYPYSQLILLVECCWKPDNLGWTQTSCLQIVKKCGCAPMTSETTKSAKQLWMTCMKLRHNFHTIRRESLIFFETGVILQTKKHDVFTWKAFLQVGSWHLNTFGHLPSSKTVVVAQLPWQSWLWSGRGVTSRSESCLSTFGLSIADLCLDGRSSSCRTVQRC